jgi:hypothetical protein
MPTTDEEERALGIRRPVYIPAISEKRKRKLGTWRVISGVLSVMLVCIASCGVAGLFGRDRIATLLSRPIPNRGTPLVVSTANVPVTPVATPGAAAKYVQNAVTATGVDGNFVPVNTTSHFLVKSTVYVVVSVRGIPKGQEHTVSVRWFIQGTDIQPVGPLSKTISQDSNVSFALNYGTPGVGTAKIYWDKPASDSGDSPNDQYLAQTINFAVEMPTPAGSTGATTPGGTTPPAGTTPTTKP